MDMRTLGYFLAVAREENITRAARLLHLTQPTLSRQMQQLEEELGAKLFTRSSHHIRLTPEGALFRRRAQEMMDLMERSRSELAPRSSELAGTIAIGCNEVRSMEELATLIADFQQKHPRVKFQLHSGANEDIRDRMERGILDMGLLLEPASIAAYDFTRMRTRERWGALVHEQCPLAKLEAIRPGDMVGTPVVTVRVNTPVHRELAAWSGDQAKRMEFSVNYNVLYDAVIVARRKKSAAVCLDLDCAWERMRFIPFEPALETTSILTWKEHQTNSATVDEFIQFVKSRYS